jgi:RsiW-degrading membrane proteinase PrsW (M82 family)
MNTFLDIVASLLPVLIFLIALVVMDSYKLIKPMMIIQAIVWGCLAGGIALFINRFFIRFIPHQSLIISVVVAPIIEETVKSLYPLFLLKKKKIGFLVDSAIFGFAAGAGFALMENLFFLQTLGERSIFVWLIRGLGTAVMHGGTTAILMIIASYLLERQKRIRFATVSWGFLTAILIHSGFNYLVHIISAELIVIAQLVVLPLLLSLIFINSEKSLRKWLEEGLAANVQLLSDIRTGHFRETKAGHYLYGLQEHLAGEILADIFCYLLIYLELSAQAKALLILKETGLQPVPDPGIQAKFTELKQLEKNIGKTGQLAMAPLLRTSPRDLWQLYFLNQQSDQSQNLKN